MNIRSEYAITELDGILDRIQESSQLADELFSVVDLLQGSPTLRRALTDPATPAERREELARGLLQSRVGEGTVELVGRAVARRLGGTALLDGLERQAIRALLRIAGSERRLDDVEDELFRFGRVVEGDAGLRGAITDRTRALQQREALVEQLLTGKVQPQTIRLARRAVAARDRNFARTLNGYIQQAAQMRGRVIATVRVARPLEPAQWERLQQVLSRQIGHEVALQEVVEPQLLGGIRVELGDEVIEGTVAGRLESVRRQFG